MASTLDPLAAQHLLAGLEATARRLATEHALQRVAEVVGDDPHTSPWLRARTRTGSSAPADPRFEDAQDLVGFVRMAAGAGEQGLCVAAEVALMALELLDELLDALDAAISDRRSRALTRQRREAAAWSADLEGLLAEGPRSPLAEAARSASDLIATRNAMGRLGAVLSKTLAQGRTGDFRTLVAEAFRRWGDDTEAVQLNPLRRLVAALEAGELEDAALETAARLLAAERALCERPPRACSVDVYAPHLLSPLAIESYARGRLIGARGLVHRRAGSGFAPYHQLHASASATDWRALAAAALDNPDLIGCGDGPRQLHLLVTDGETLELVARHLAAASPERVSYHRPGTLRSTAVGVRVHGRWRGVPVGLHCVLDLGGNARGQSSETRVAGAIKAGRLDPHFADVPKEDWTGKCGDSWEPAETGVVNLEHLLRDGCGHQESQWQWNEDEDALLLVCAGCGGMPLACVPVHQLPEARGPAGPAAVTPSLGTIPEALNRIERRGAFHAALAGGRAPDSWEEMIAASPALDPDAVKARILADAKPRAAGRRCDMRGALGAGRRVPSLT